MGDLDWQALARTSTHPLALRILERAAAAPDERFSASELAGEFGEKLGNVSYHLRTLYAKGLLRKAGTKTVRGALERYYRIAGKSLT